MATLEAKLAFSGPVVVDEDGAEEGLRGPKETSHSGPNVMRETLRRWIPEQLRLGSLRDPRLRLVEAIDVAIAVEDGQVVAEAVELNEFGWGANVSEAILDLQRALAELYFQLEADEHRLGPGLQAVWDVLRRKIRSSRA